MQKCEICGSTEKTLIATEMREGPGKIYQCNACGLVYQGLHLSTEDIESYYNEEYELTNSLKLGEKLSPKGHFEARMRSIAPFVELVNPYLKKDMSVLEVGCGAGELLCSIKPFVKKVTGLELNKGYVNFINKDLGVEAHALDINDYHPKEKFDLIVSVNTIDHMPNPLQSLVKIKSLLSKQGFLYLMVPNRDEAMNCYLPEPTRSKFNKFFWHKAHFFYFTADSLTRILNKAGFACENISTFHQYTLRNFLQWYYLGAPQKSSDDARLNLKWFSGESAFEKGMNQLFEGMESKFHQVINESLRGDLLKCVALQKENAGTGDRRTAQNSNMAINDTRRR
ncbi:MAG: hypothetical protein A2Z88_06285 [Omnitrophica WOR_2 bacterium GWA2_47_8]|nr:MAG: hypothetical protein A2Z88_06285 [Omnitrophica WOR_2 bacterium GWA2_47_8]